MSDKTDRVAYEALDKAMTKKCQEYNDLLNENTGFENENRELRNTIQKLKKNIVPIPVKSVLMKPDHDENYADCKECNPSMDPQKVFEDLEDKIKNDHDAELKANTNILRIIVTKYRDLEKENKGLRRGIGKIKSKYTEIKQRNKGLRKSYDKLKNPHEGLSKEETRLRRNFNDNIVPALDYDELDFLRCKAKDNEKEIKELIEKNQILHKLNSAKKEYNPFSSSSDQIKHLQNEIIQGNILVGDMEKTMLRLMNEVKNFDNRNRTLCTENENKKLKDEIKNLSTYVIKCASKPGFLPVPLPLSSAFTHNWNGYDGHDLCDCSECLHYRAMMDKHY